MTCRTLLALISAAVVWNLPNNILAQANQEGSEQTPGTATDAKDGGTGTEAVLQLQAKKSKTPPKPKAKAKKSKAPAKPVKSKAPVKKPTPKPAPPPPKVQPKPTPYFPPAPPVDDILTEPLPTDNTRFQVPMPEEKGDLNIWATDPAAAAEPFDPLAVNNQFGLVGVANYLGAGFGLEYMRRSLTWMDWGLQIMSTKASLESKKSNTDEFLESTMSAARINARFFNNRWLYFATGLGINSIEGTYGWRGTGITGNEISTDFQAQMIQLDVALGSQWEPGKGFYIGVDWFGLGLPLTSTVTYDSNADLDIISTVLTGSTAEERIRNELSAQFRPFYVLLKFGYML